MDDLLFFFGQGIGFTLVVMFIVGYFCWPILLTYAVFSECRSMRRIASALEHRAYTAAAATPSEPLPRPSPAIAPDNSTAPAGQGVALRHEMPMSQFGR